MLGDNDDCDGDPETRMIVIIIRRKSEVIRVHSSDMLQLTFHGVFVCLCVFKIKWEV